MNLHDYVLVVRARWLVIVSCVIGGVMLAGIYTALTPKIYQATAQNFVAVGGIATGGQLAGSGFALSRVKSYVQLVDTPEVLAPVIAELGLQTTVPALASTVSAANPPETVLLNVSVSNGQPAQAKAIANAVAASYAKRIEAIETPEGATGPTVRVTVTNPASIPVAPISPNIKINLAVGFLLGLGVGVAAALVREQFDRSVKSEAGLRAVTECTNLGIVGYDDHADTNPLVALQQSSVRSEGYRTVRTNLRYVDVDQPPKIVVVTSSVPNEGKTTTACNLSIAMAQAGAKVCLVEGDLRKPHVADYLGVDGNVGLIDVLTGELSLEDAIVPWQRGLLSVLPCGPTPPNPSEILGTRQLGATLDRLREMFDYVIVDAAPLLPVTDSAVLAHQADGAILVVRHGRTSRDQVRHACEALDAVGARLLGTVLNFVPAKESAYGGSYAYGYGYGYGYGNRYGYGYGNSYRAGGEGGRVTKVTAPQE